MVSTIHGCVGRKVKDVMHFLALRIDTGGLGMKLFGTDKITKIEKRKLNILLLFFE